mmetsp:Transcript_41494/g.83100  ORF Transcript_41494/g.83100 Transcript_41494/m.83100 type:complete len:250 (+) Transcript_41494:432-1181(+)
MGRPRGRPRLRQHGALLPLPQPQPACAAVHPAGGVPAAAGVRAKPPRRGRPLHQHRHDPPRPPARAERAAVPARGADHQREHAGPRPRVHRHLLPRHRRGAVDDAGGAAGGQERAEVPRHPARPARRAAPPRPGVPPLDPPVCGPRQAPGSAEAAASAGRQCHGQRDAAAGGVCQRRSAGGGEEHTSCAHCAPEERETGRQGWARSRPPCRRRERRACWRDCCAVMLQSAAVLCGKWTQVLHTHIHSLL